MNRRPSGSDGPEDVDAAFAEIVAELEREGIGLSLFEQTDDDPPPPTTTALASADEPVEQADEPVSPPPPPGWRTPEADWDWAAASEEEHFVPPEPPPLPRLRPGTVFGILLLLVGVFLLVAPGVIGLAPRIGTPLALVSLATGIGWLVLRMRQGPPPDSGWDNGAQL